MEFNHYVKLMEEQKLSFFMALRGFCKIVGNSLELQKQKAIGECRTLHIEGLPSYVHLLLTKSTYQKR
jgi:hypothetical protein